MSKIYVNTVSPLSGNAVTASHGVMLSGVASGTLAGPSSYLGIDTDGLMVLTASSGGGGGVTNPVADDTKLYFGTGNESYIVYDEAVTDFMVISGSSVGMALSGSEIVIDGTLTPAVGAYNLVISGGLVVDPFSGKLPQVPLTVFRTDVYLEEGYLSIESGSSQLAAFAEGAGQVSITCMDKIAALTLSGSTSGLTPANYISAIGSMTIEAYHIFPGEAPCQLHLSASGGTILGGASLRMGTASAPAVPGTKDTVNSGSIAGPGSYLGLTETGQVVLTASSGGGVTNPLGVDVPLYFDDAATDFYIQKTDTGFGNGALEIVSKGYGGFATLGGTISLSSSFGVTIDTVVLGFTAGATELLGPGSPPYSVMTMNSAPSGSEGNSAVPLILAMSGGFRNDPGTYSGVNLVSANSISLYSGFASPATGYPNPGEGWLEISSSAGTWMSGSSLRLDPITVASGTAAGPGSLLSVTEDGQVVLTSSAGGGGGGGSPGGSTTQIQYNDGGAFAGAPNIIYKNNAATTDGTLLKITGSTHFQLGQNFNSPKFQVGAHDGDTTLNQHAIYVTRSLSPGLQIIGISNDDPHWQGGGLDIVHDLSIWPGGTPSYMPDGQRGGGHRLRSGPNFSLEEGTLYYMSGATGSPWYQWHTASATISNSAPHMLALGMGGPAGEYDTSASVTPGVVLEGYFNIPSAQVRNMPTTPGSTIGVPLYVSNFAGKIDFNAPTGSGEFVRVVGYALGEDDKSGDLLIRFNPDCTWVDIT